MLTSSTLPPNRSISFPTALHPISLRVEAEMNKLRAWETRSCSSSQIVTAETVRTGLVGLSEAYRCAEELVYSSLTQHGKVMETALDHSVKLLDICDIVKDAQQKMKEQVLHFQSCFRRNCDYKESRFHEEISTYLRLRKKLKIEASKWIRSLKQCERKVKVVVIKDYQLAMAVRVLREVNVMTFRVLRYLLLFLSSPGTTNKKKGGGCSLIAKLRRNEKEEEIMNEVGSVDGSVMGVLHGKEEMRMADRKLSNLVISLDGIEAGLDLLFRRLVRYRVSILNVLTR